jgi:hypothetical protein
MIDTTAEMIAGYAVAAMLFGGYGLSLWLRARRVRRQLDALLIEASSRRSRTSGPSRRSR